MVCLPLLFIHPRGPRVPRKIHRQLSYLDCHFEGTSARAARNGYVKSGESRLPLVASSRTARRVYFNIFHFSQPRQTARQRKIRGFRSGHPAARNFEVATNAFPSSRHADTGGGGGGAFIRKFRAKGKKDVGTFSCLADDVILSSPCIFLFSAVCNNDSYGEQATDVEFVRALFGRNPSATSPQ